MGRNVGLEEPAVCPISGYGSSVISVLSNVEVKEVRKVWFFAVLTHTRLTPSVPRRLWVSLSAKIFSPTMDEKQVKK